jgi:predicted secreted protein
VDKGFVAQVANVDGGRQVPLNAAQKAEAIKTVPLEVKADVKHYEGKSLTYWQ